MDNPDSGAEKLRFYRIHIPLTDQGQALAAKRVLVENGAINVSLQTLPARRLIVITFRGRLKRAEYARLIQSEPRVPRPVDDPDAILRAKDSLKEIGRSSNVVVFPARGNLEHDMNLNGTQEARSSQENPQMDLELGDNISNSTPAQKQPDAHEVEDEKSQKKGDTNSGQGELF